MRHSSGIAIPNHSLNSSLPERMSSMCETMSGKVGVVGQFAK